MAHHCSDLHKMLIIFLKKVRFIPYIVFPFSLSILLTKPFNIFTDVMTDLYNYVNPKNGKHSPLISKETHEIIMNNADVSEKDFENLT